MKHFRDRPTFRRNAAVISLAAAAPLLLSSCGGSPAEENPADSVGQHESTVQPKQLGSLVKAAQPEQERSIGNSFSDPVSVPDGKAEIIVPEAEPVAAVAARSFHIVSSGDTLAGIAEAYGWGDWLEVASYNNIPAPHILFEGQKVSAPAASHAAPTTTSRPAAVFTPASSEPAKETPKKEPVVVAPAVEAPAVEAPVATAPAESPAPVEVNDEVKAPVVTKPAVSKPVSEKPTVEAPVLDAPQVEAPTVVEPTPVPEVPVVPEPVVEDAPAPAPVVPEPVVVEPAPAPVAPVEEPVQEPTAPAPSTGSTEFSQRSLELINAYRAANGVHALVYDERLEALAVNWAGSQKESIEANGWAGIGHNPNLASELPAGWTNYGENIAVNYSPEDMFTWWTNSPAHNAGMLSPALDAFGFGSAQLDIFTGNYVGVQVFARY